MIKASIPKRLYCLKNASLYLDLGLHGVRNLIWTSQIPVVKIGRKQFIDIADLERFISQNKRNYADGN